MSLKKSSIIYVILVFAILSGTLRLTDNGMTSFYRIFGPFVALAYMLTYIGKFKKPLIFFGSLLVYTLFTSVVFYSNISFDQIAFVIYIFFEFVLIMSLKIKDKNFGNNFFKFIDICAVVTIAAAWLQYFVGYTLPHVEVSRGQPLGVYFSNGNTAIAPTLNFAGTGTIPLAAPEGKSVQSFAAGTWLHLKYVDVTISSTRHQKWLILGSNYAEQDHNVPRWVNGVLGKDITSYYNDGTLWQRLAGTNGFRPLEDLYAGDYFQMSRAITAPNQDSQYAVTGSQWVTIAGINTLRGNGDNISMDYNHLVMVPGKGETGSFHFGRKRMNSTNTTVGGYVASEMYTATLGEVVSTGSTAAGATINQQLYAEFGSHLKTTRELLSNSMGASLTNRFGSAGGASNNWGWYSCQACLMSEVEVYGSTVWSSSGYDTGTGCVQLPLFAFSKKAVNNRSSWYWLKDIASSAYF